MYANTVINLFIFFDKKNTLIKMDEVYEKSLEFITLYGRISKKTLESRHHVLLF